MFFLEDFNLGLSIAPDTYDPLFSKRYVHFSFSRKKFCAAKYKLRIGPSKSFAKILKNFGSWKILDSKVMQLCFSGQISICHRP